MAQKPAAASPTLPIIAPVKPPEPSKIILPEPKKEPVRHVRKFMGGRWSVEDFNSKYGVRKKCLCGNWGRGRIRCYVQVDEFVKREPVRAALIAAMNPEGAHLPTVPSTYGNLFCVSQVNPCDRCWVTAEREAAKAPDWVFVEIMHGPRSTISVAVPEQLTPTTH